MLREPTTKLLEPYLKIMVEKQASDLYFVTGAAPNMKVQGSTAAIAKNPFQAGQVLHSALRSVDGHSLHQVGYSDYR